jgi:hypothetical protein
MQGGGESAWAAAEDENVVLLHIVVFLHNGHLTIKPFADAI